jgi:hypothetical protein
VTRILSLDHKLSKNKLKIIELKNLRKNFQFNCSNYYQNYIFVVSFEKEELSDQEYSMEEEKRIFWDGSNSPIASRFRERRHLMETGCSSMTPLDLAEVENK